MITKAVLEQILCKYSHYFLVRNYKYECYAFTTEICVSVTDSSSKFSKHLCTCGIIPMMLETLVYFQDDINHEVSSIQFAT